MEKGISFYFQIDALVDPKDATEAELANCVDSAVVERYAGNFRILE